MPSSNDILVTTHAVLDATVKNADIDPAAAIAEAKLLFDTIAGHDHDGTDSKFLSELFSGVFTSLTADRQYRASRKGVFTGSVVPGEEPTVVPLTPVLVYLKIDGTIALANATAMATMPVLGVVVQSLGANQWVVVMDGFYRMDNVPGPPTTGIRLLASIVAGGVDPSLPVVVGNVAQFVTDVVYVNGTITIFQIHPDTSLFVVE